MTQNELKELITYDKNTGIFKWNKTRKGCKKGSICGSINGRGYHEIKINGKRFLSHRLAFLYEYGRFPKNEIDHIDHNILNNKFDNLREVSKLENARNQKIHKSNNSGVCGVRFRESRKRWIAEINVNGKTQHIGSFTSKEEAIKARKETEQKLNYHKNHGN